MKTMKFFLLVLVGLLGFFRVQAVAPCDSPIASGTIGNLTWTLCPDSTLTISGTGEMGSFYETSDAPWCDYASSISSVIIENGVTSIASYAFMNCSNLTSIAIPNSVTSIGSSVFANCLSLTTIDVAKNNANYSSENGVLFNKAKTALIHYPANKTGTCQIPNSIIYINHDVFAYCSSLTAIDVAEDNANYTSVNGALFNKAKTKLICCPEGKTGTYQIPNSVTSIGYRAFSHCSNLTSITISNSVTSIGYEAFSHCSSLTSITIPNSVTSIENYAFLRCRNLTSITIPNSITSIGEGAFSYCSSLTSITIPNSITSIGEGAFSYCSSLTSIAIPSSVASIENNVFLGCSSLTSITIPFSITSIGELAFSDCSSLTSITIPNSVTSIGEGVFTGCRSLISVTNLAATPQEINNTYVFYLVPLDKATLTVPVGAKALYEVAEGWKDFGTIKETAITIDETNPDKPKK